MHAEPLPGCEHMVEVAVSRLMQCADYTSQRLRAGQGLFWPGTSQCARIEAMNDSMEICRSPSALVHWLMVKTQAG